MKNIEKTIRKNGVVAYSRTNNRLDYNSKDYIEYAKKILNRKKESAK